MSEPKVKKPRAKKPPQAVEIVTEVVPAIVEQPLVPADFKTKLSKEQVALIKRTIALGATDDELKMFLYVCERSKLDPFTRQIYFVKRWDSKEGKEKGAIQVGIDGLRSVAERTGQYAGNDDAVFGGEELDLEYKPKEGKAQPYKAPSQAFAKVYKMVEGVRCEFTAMARWTEYYPGDRQGFMWRTKPHIMLGKCAEALALRKAFPAVLSGLYITEEMDSTKAIEAGAPENKEDDAFAKAKLVIGRTADVEVLADFHKKVESSTLYSAKNKKALVEAIQARVKEISPEIPADDAQKVA